MIHLLRYSKGGNRKQRDVQRTRHVTSLKPTNNKTRKNKQNSTNYQQLLLTSNTQSFHSSSYDFGIQRSRLGVKMTEKFYWHKHNEIGNQTRTHINMNISPNRLPDRRFYEKENFLNYAPMSAFCWLDCSFG